MKAFLKFWQLVNIFMGGMWLGHAVIRNDWKALLIAAFFVAFGVLACPWMMRVLDEIKKP